MAIIDGIKVSGYIRRRRRPASTVDPLVKEYLDFVGGVLAADLDRALEKDRLAGWPEDVRQRIQEGGP